MQYPDGASGVFELLPTAGDPKITFPIMRLNAAGCLQPNKRASIIF
jgi:hypothetical protein